VIALASADAARILLAHLEESRIMGLLDGLAGGLGKQAAEAIAAKLGIDQAMAESAIEALTRNHPLPNDTIQQSAEETGFSGDMLNQIVNEIGGEGGLGALVGALAQGQGQDQAGEGAGGLGGILAGLGGLGGMAQMLDRDGDGSPVDDVLGMFVKK
jgi:hypothetical protein